MSATPAFRQVNLVVSDMESAVRFYRLLGLELSPPISDWPPGSGALHLGTQSGTAGDLDLDNVTMANLWGHSELQAGTSVIGFSMPSREAVNEKYAELVAAGYVGRVEPYDAFFGARYAIVADPDGHNIGLMSPIDASRKFTPQV